MVKALSKITFFLKKIEPENTENILRGRTGRITIIISKYIHVNQDEKENLKSKKGYKNRKLVNCGNLKVERGNQGRTKVLIFKWKKINTRNLNRYKNWAQNCQLRLNISKKTWSLGTDRHFYVLFLSLVYSTPLTPYFSRFTLWH